MVRSPNETSSRSRLAKLLCDYRAFKTDENETATARWKTAENLGSLDTDPGRAGSVLVNSVNSADVEKAGDWSEMDSDGTFSTDAELETRKKQRRLRQSNRESRRSNSRQPIVSRECLGGSGNGEEVQGPSGRFPLLCGRTSWRSPRMTRSTRPLCST